MIGERKINYVAINDHREFNGTFLSCLEPDA